MQYLDNRTSETHDMLVDFAALLGSIVAIGIVLAVLLTWMQG